MKREIRKVLKAYTEAFYKQEYTKAYQHLDKESTKDYRDKIVAFAEQMDVFGETEDFLSRLKITNLEALKRLSTKAFMIKLFALLSREMKENDLKRMLKGLKILEIDERAQVKYEMPVPSFNSWTRMTAIVNFKETSTGWKMLFNSGLDRLLHDFQKEIDQYNERASKDQPSLLNHHENDMEVYTLKGYKNMDGEVILEARFKDAGVFSEGLAFVKIMNKYGYINKKGKITLKPRYYDAHDFSEGLAAVKNKNDYWGFINKKATQVIDYEYTAVQSFNEGLCAVQKNNKWGFINKKGKTIIEHQYHLASNFFQGEADVIILNSDGDEIEYCINKKGRKID